MGISWSSKGSEETDEGGRAYCAVQTYLIVQYSDIHLELTCDSGSNIESASTSPQGPNASYIRLYGTIVTERASIANGS